MLKLRLVSFNEIVASAKPTISYPLFHLINFQNRLRWLIRKIKVLTFVWITCVAKPHAITKSCGKSEAKTSFSSVEIDGKWRTSTPSWCLYYFILYENIYVIKLGIEVDFRKKYTFKHLRKTFSYFFDFYMKFSRNFICEQ